MTGTLAGSCPGCNRPWPDCTCGIGEAMLAGAHADAEPEFRGRGLLIRIDVDDIKVGDILTTGQDIEVAGAWYCSAPGCGSKSIDRAAIEGHIAHLRRQAPSGDDAGADGES